MPNGYTAPIYKGEDISVTDFAARCARGMGYTIHQRDDGYDTPLHYRSSEKSYYKESLTKAKTELLRWNSLTEEEKYTEWSEYFHKQNIDRANAYARNAAMRSRYLNMIARVEATPVDSLMESTKEFMLKNLHDSMEFDCSDDDFIDSFYKTLDYVSWCNKQEYSLTRDVDYYTSELEKEEERVEETNRYLDSLSKCFDIDIVTDFPVDSK